MKKLITNKWLMIAMFIIFTAVFDLAVDNTSLHNRAIVVGLAIDKCEEGVEVTVQVLNPSTGGIENAKNNVVVVSYKDVSVPKCIERISTKGGIQISLAYCNIVILSQEILAVSHLSAIKYLVEIDELNTSAYLLTADKTAKEYLELEAPIAEANAYYIEQILSTRKNDINLNEINLKNYLYNYYDIGGVCWLPVLSKTEILPPRGSDTKAEKTYMLNFDQTAIVNAQSEIFLIKDSANVGLSFAKGKVANGAISVTNGDKKFEASVLDAKTTYKALAPNKIKMECKADIMLGERSGEYLFSQPISDFELNLIKAEIERNLEAILKEIKDNNADILHFGGLLYKKFGNTFKNNITKDYVKDIEVEIEVKIKVK
ncbi:MAG: Ger(x)C family spore germination C-terminal domain-containing protein [Clostridia bacterium]